MWVEAWLLLRKNPLAVPHNEVTDLQGGGHGYGMMDRGQHVTDMGWIGGDLEVTDLQEEWGSYCWRVKVLVVGSTQLSWVGVLG